MTVLPASAWLAATASYSQARSAGEWWTPERIDELRRMFAAGLSFGLIAREMGTTRNKVMGKAYRLGLAREGPAFDRRALPPRPRPEKPRARPGPPKPAGSGVTLVETDHNGCRFPTGLRGDDHLFCNAPAASGSSYCAWHVRRAYVRERGEHGAQAAAPDHAGGGGADGEPAGVGDLRLE